MAKRKVALYPGSFDPLTCGHLDVIQRSLEVFDHLVIGVGFNDEKSGFFTVNERMEMIRESCGSPTHLEIQSFSGLTVSFAKQIGASVIVRGLRNEMDYQFEFQMAMTNRVLGSGMETIFFPTRQELCHISSRLVREIARLGGDVSALVPPPVVARLKAKLI